MKTSVLHHIETTKKLKKLIRQPFAWPGGYECFAVFSDGNVLCHDCAKKDFFNLCYELYNDYSCVDVGCTANCNPTNGHDEYSDAAIYCASCNKLINDNGEE